MSAPATTPGTEAAPAKKSKLPLVIVCVLSVGGGVALPMFVNVPALLGNTKEGEKAKAKPKGDGERRSSSRSARRKGRW